MLNMLIKEAKVKVVTEISLDATDQGKPLYEKCIFVESGEGMVLNIKWGFWLKDSNYLFGGSGINFNEEMNCFVLGYNIMHKYWNQGYTKNGQCKICVRRRK